MRELTIDEMEQVGGGVNALAYNMVTGCVIGAISGDSTVQALFNCSAGMAITVSFSIALASGPIGMVGWTAVGLGIGYAAHRANEWYDGMMPGNNGGSY